MGGAITIEGYFAHNNGCHAPNQAAGILAKLAVTKHTAIRCGRSALDGSQSQPCMPTNGASEYTTSCSTISTGSSDFNIFWE